MPIFKYAKVLVLAPAIGSALIGVAGLLLVGGILIAGRGQAGNPTGHDPASIERLLQGLPAHSTSAVGKQKTDMQRSAANENLQPKTLKPQAGNAAPTQIFPDAQSSLLRRPIDSSQLAFLKDLAGRPADGSDDKQRVKSLVGMVTPSVPYHFGADFPLPMVISSLLLNDPQPIEIREGRYATISGMRIAIQNRAALLWVDMREGIVLGAIYFVPTNGEPSPTLTIFSRQLDRKALRMSQLPRAFQQDLNRWAAKEGVPPVETRYFIGASGDKYVLPHDENYCAPQNGVPVPFSKTECEELNAQAAIVDSTASRFMEQTHNAPNATFRMIASTNPIATTSPVEQAHVEQVVAVRQPQYGTFNDGRIRDSLTGVELTVPKGWIFRGEGPSSGGGQMVRLQSSSNILVSIWMKPGAAKPSQIPRMLNQAMQNKSSMRSGGWRIRPDSVMQRLLTGVSGLSSVADYFQNGMPMVEYDFWMQSGKTHVLFFGVTELQYLPALQAAVETVATSAQIP